MPFGALFSQVNRHAAGFAGFAGHFRPPTRTRARGQTVTRNRGPWCRCRGMPAESIHCAHAEPTTSAMPPSPRPSSSRCGELQDSPGTRPRYGPRGWRRAGGSALRVREGITSLAPNPLSVGRCRRGCIDEYERRAARWQQATPRSRSGSASNDDLASSFVQRIWCA